jgi:flagellar basal body-associated protein FliL
VVEEFEVKDALMNALAAKNGTTWNPNEGMNALAI